MIRNSLLRAVIRYNMPVEKSDCPRFLHVKARNGTYPRNEKIKRFEVPDDKVTWDTEYPEYAPVEYTAPSVLAKPVWADPDYKKVFSKDVRWNQVDGNINRVSYEGQYYVIEKTGIPRNIIGRTGVCSRGLLGRWGPNHAADPIVTRWKRTPLGEIEFHKGSGKRILQFVAIQRRDSGEWAIPGGMVDPGDTITITLSKEFSEEALNILEMSLHQKREISKNVKALFAKGQEGMVNPGEELSFTLKREFSEETMNALEVPRQDLLEIKRRIKETLREGWEVYRGYVDDPRNTDNAWMETVAVNFHDEKGDSVAKFKLHAGDDAVGVKWTDLHGDIKLYASHVEFCEKVARKHKAHW